MNDSREQDQAWVPLNEQTPKALNPHGTVVASASHDTPDMGSHIGIETNGQQILVTNDTTVTSEQCSEGSRVDVEP